MLSYVARRLIQMIPIILGIAVIAFVIVHIAPGSPVDKFRTGRTSPQVIQNLIRLYGLDKDLGTQLVSWITTFFQPWLTDNSGRHIAWGFSFVDGRSVIEKIAERVPATLLLMGTSLVATVIIAIPVGVLAAVKQYSLPDKVITVLTTIGYAMPTFWLGLMLKFVFSQKLGWFPLYGMHSPFSTDPLDVAWHMVMPVTTLTIVSVAGWSRYMRSSMLEVLRQDYIRTARAKGLANSRVLGKHALRNALIPIVTLLGLTIPTLLGGAIITETIWQWPGLGYLGFNSVTERDYPVVLATVMLGGFMVIIGNLVADVLYAVVDPRIKY